MVEWCCWTSRRSVVGIEDSADLFTSDTLKGGAKKPGLAKVLCENSGADVEWLMDKFNLSLNVRTSCASDT